MTEDSTVVETAASAAEGYILSQYASSDIADVDIRVSYREKALTVDIFIDTNATTEEAEMKEQAVVDDAIVVAHEAVDELLAEAN